MHLYRGPALSRCDLLPGDRGNTVPRCPTAETSSVLRSRCNSLTSVVQPNATDTAATMHRSLSDASNLADRFAFRTLPAVLFFFILPLFFSPTHAPISPPPLSERPPSPSRFFCTHHK